MGNEDLSEIAGEKPSLSEVRPLESLEAEWLVLFETMQSSPETYGIRAGALAAPFLSASSTNYRPESPGTVLLVGKATAGRNTLGGAAVRDTYNVETVKLRTLAVIEEVLLKEYGSSWWRFARRLSENVARATAQECSPFSNLVWTNLIKIGVVSGNPSAAYIRPQAELAENTLLAEAAFYRPALMVLSTGFYRFGLMCRILRRLVGDAPNTEAQKRGWWTHAGDEGRPAILWTGHPQAKRTAITEEWLAQAYSLSQTGKATGFQGTVMRLDLADGRRIPTARGGV